MNEFDAPAQLYRLDPLAGCANLLSFVEFLEARFGQPPVKPFSLISLDANGFAQLNAEHGVEQGDVVLRWIALVLEEEAQEAQGSQGRLYRVGGDEFVLMVEGGRHSFHAWLGKRIFERLNRQAGQLGMQSPVAAITVIHYTGEEGIRPADVFIQLGMAIHSVKTNGGKGFQRFQARNLAVNGSHFPLRWIGGHMVERMVSLGAMLDESHRLAYTDPVSGLPNSRHAEQRLQAAADAAAATRGEFAVLLIDGDDLKRYNAISYAAGDEMIQRLSATLAEQLRPNDFLARWRMGDEFLVILGGASLEHAAHIGQRLCLAVQRASQPWPLPVTISIGAAGFPLHGPTPNELLSHAAAANKRAKSMGKNRVAVA